MFRRRLIPVWIGIILLSGMFLMGQEGWGPEPPPPVGMVRIPGGCFSMGDHFDEGEPDELPVHDVCISTFDMDMYEVTNAQYEECRAAGGCTAPHNLSSYTRDEYYSSSYAQFPVIWVDRYQAWDYCHWAGKRLPHEAQWEYAARGGLDNKRYPWGDTIDGADANYWNSGDPWNNDTSPVGDYEPNEYGLYDMAGNVWEWTGDWYAETYYQYCLDHGIVNDPPGPEPATGFVVRGGSWHNPTGDLRVANRGSRYPSFEDYDVGFRCVSSIP